MEENTLERHLDALRGDEAELRAMKRALANAPLGPKAVLALSSAIIAIQNAPLLRPRPRR